MTSSHGSQRCPQSEILSFKIENLHSKRDWALMLAENGFFIFPLVPGLKVPKKGLAWKTEATRNPEKIHAWWGENETYNIGVLAWKFRDTSLVVVDLDVKNGKNGILAWGKIADENGGAPPTLEVQTPSGGKHLYYLTSTPFRTSHGELTPGIDIQSLNAYVVGPGSSIGGNYYSLGDGHE